jgi:HK97 family phage major capsid protein/HK97 family phage prohead protease
MGKTAETIEKQKGLFRRFVTDQAFDVQRAEGQTPTLTFAASSEMPVERWYGMEVLSHAKGAVRMDRATGGAMPLLFNHDINDPIGMITGARLSGGRMVVDATLFQTARAAEVQTMIDGGLHNVSLAYRVNVLEENTKTQTFTATDWQPYEVSIVTVPADPSVGIGRHESEYDVRMIRSTTAESSALTKESTMGDGKEEVRSAVVLDEAPKLNPVQAEKQRRTGIENLCKANKLPDETRDHWISAGASMNTVAEEMLGIMEERGRVNPQSVARLGLTKKESKRFNICKAIDSCGGKNWQKAEFEAECSQEIAKRLGDAGADANKFYVPLEIQERELPTSMEARTYGMGRRDLTVATGSAGGFLVETANVGFIELLRNRSVLMNMGATRLTGLMGNVAIPKQTTAGTITWLANEASTITETNQVFAQVTMTPKTVGGYTELSRLLLLQSSPSAEGLVMSDLAAIVSLAVDLAGLNGSGASGQPTGIINTGGIGGVTGTSLAYAGIVEFQTDVATGNALTANCGYVTTPAVAGLLKQRVKFTSTASPIWDGQLLDANVDGYRGMASNQVPSANMLFGDFGQLILGEWGVLALETNPYANFQAGIVGVRAIYTVDFGVRIPAAFSLATAIT